MAADCRVPNGDTRCEGYRREESQDFVADTVEIRHAFQKPGDVEVRVCEDFRIGNMIVNFGAETSLNRWVLGKQVGGPGQCRGCSFVTVLVSFASEQT